MTHEELINKLDDWAVYDCFYAQTMNALRAVVELHNPKMYEGRVSNYLICTGCYEEEGQNYDYPCPTIQTIEKELG